MKNYEQASGKKLEERNKYIESIKEMKINFIKFINKNQKFDLDYLCRYLFLVSTGYRIDGNQAGGIDVQWLYTLDFKQQIM